MLLLVQFMPLTKVLNPVLNGVQFLVLNGALFLALIGVWFSELNGEQFLALTGEQFSALYGERFLALLTPKYCVHPKKCHEYVHPDKYCRLVQNIDEKYTKHLWKNKKEQIIGIYCSAPMPLSLTSSLYTSLYLSSSFPPLSLSLTLSLFSFLSLFPSLISLYLNLSLSTTLNLF